MNDTFFRKRAWPIMRSVATFILDFLVEEPAGSPVAGIFVTTPSHSPENGGGGADEDFGRTGFDEKATVLWSMAVDEVVGAFEAVDDGFDAVPAFEFVINGVMFDVVVVPLVA